LPYYQSASLVIHGRLLLEAKRQLLSATAPVALIAFKIGFRDPAYFSRISKKYSHNAGAAHRPAREKPSQPISKKMIASRRHLPANAGFSAALRWLHIASADSLYS
jgi:hypothetical protein